MGRVKNGNSFCQNLIDIMYQGWLPNQRMRNSDKVSVVLGTETHLKQRGTSADWSRELGHRGSSYIPLP